MDLPRIGFDLVDKSSATGALAAVKRAEDRGVPMAWSTISRGMPDAMTFFAAAAAETERIGLGTAIVPTYPRHPAVLATQTIALAQLAPGRFRLGIGPSHRPTIEGGLGIPMGRPLNHLREYLTVLQSLLREGRSDFDGEYYQVHTEMNGTADVPIYISALRSNAFRLAGEAADGAISWLCPLDYLRDTAIPSMRAGARDRNRPEPRMIAHVPVVMTSDRERMLEVAKPRVNGYGRLPFYANMFADAGYPTGDSGEVSDDLLEHLIVWGSDEQVHDRLAAAYQGGIDEVLVMLIPADDLSREEQRLSAVLSSFSR